MEKKTLFGKGLLHISIFQTSRQILNIKVNLATGLDPTLQDSKVTVQILSGQQRTTLFTTKSAIREAIHELGPLHDYNSEHQIHIVKEELIRKRLLFNLFTNCNVYDKTEQLTGCFSLSFCSLIGHCRLSSSEIVDGWFLLLPPYRGTVENVQVSSEHFANLTHRNLNEMNTADTRMDNLEVDSNKNIVEVCTQINQMFNHDAEVLNSFEQKSLMDNNNKSQVFHDERYVTKRLQNDNLSQIKPVKDTWDKNVFVTSGNSLPGSRISETPFRLKRRASSFRMQRRVDREDFHHIKRKLTFEHSSLPQLSSESNDTPSNNRSHCFKKLKSIESEKSVGLNELPEAQNFDLDLCETNFDNGLCKTDMQVCFKKHIPDASCRTLMNESFKTQIDGQFKSDAENESSSFQTDLCENSSRAPSKNFMAGQTRFLPGGFLKSMKKQTLKLKALKYRLLECHHCGKTETKDELSTDPESRSEAGDTISQDFDPAYDNYNETNKTYMSKIRNTTNSFSVSRNDGNESCLQCSFNKLDVQSGRSEIMTLQQNDSDSQMKQEQSSVLATVTKGQYRMVFVRRWVIGFFRDSQRQELGFSITDISCSSQIGDQNDLNSHEKYDNTSKVPCVPVYTKVTLGITRKQDCLPPRDQGTPLFSTSRPESLAWQDKLDFDEIGNYLHFNKCNQDKESLSRIIPGSCCSLTDTGNTKKDKDGYKTSKNHETVPQTLRKCKPSEEVAEMDGVAGFQYSDGTRGQSNKINRSLTSQSQTRFISLKTSPSSNPSTHNSLSTEAFRNGRLFPTPLRRDVTPSVVSVGSRICQREIESISDKTEEGYQQIRVQIPNYCKPSCIKSCCKRGRGDGSESPSIRDQKMKPRKWNNVISNSDVTHDNLSQYCKPNKKNSKSCSTVLNHPYLQDSSKIRRSIKSNENKSSQPNNYSNYNVSISQVAPGSVADDWGLLSGDKIIAVNYKSTRRMGSQQMSQILRDAESDIMLEIERTSTRLVATFL